MIKEIHIRGVDVDLLETQRRALNGVIDNDAVRRFLRASQVELLKGLAAMLDSWSDEQIENREGKKMKRNFRNINGEFVTKKEWFAQNCGCLTMPEVTNELNWIEDRLKDFEEYATVKLSKIELAIFAATEIEVEQSKNRVVHINRGGRVTVEFGYSAAIPNRAEVFNSLRDEFQQRYNKQLEAKAMADSTWVEVPDRGGVK